MVSSLQAKVSRLEAAAGGGDECPECGGPDKPDDHTPYEIVFIDPGGPEDWEEWCETCGRQTGIVLRWPEDMP
jgi:hypothetical protein